MITQVIFPEPNTLGGIFPPKDRDRSKFATSPSELPDNFTGRGEVRMFEFKQIEKSDTAYVYEVKPPDCPVHFEVIKRMINTRFNRVSYPGAKSFGLTGWSYRTFEEAQQKFNEL